jgi:transcription antitermination factor NusG
VENAQLLLLLGQSPVGRDFSYYLLLTGCRCKQRGEALSQTLEWYAVRTRSNCEAKVRVSLTEKGMESYLPTFREVRQWKDRKMIIEQALLPGYLFARFVDCRDARLSVLCSDGVVNLLGQGNAIEPVPEAEIEAIRQLLSSSLRCQAHPLVREGAWVRVKRGSLKDMEGLLVRVKNQARLIVSLTLLSQSVSTEIDVSDVQFLRSTSRQVRRIA